MFGSALVRDSEFQDRVVAETRPAGERFNGGIGGMIRARAALGQREVVRLLAAERVY